MVCYTVITDTFILYYTNISIEEKQNDRNKNREKRQKMGTNS